MIITMQFIVTRHAQTEYNKKKLINGSYASPMHRSLQTAEPIAKHFGVALREDSRLTEVNLGSFQGQGWDATIPDFGVNSSGVLSSEGHGLAKRANRINAQERKLAFLNSVLQPEANA